MAYKQKSPISIKEGGSNAISFDIDQGVMVYDGTRMVSIDTGSSGQILVSNGPTLRPAFQSGGTTSITMNGDTGTATSSVFTVAGGTNVNTAMSGTTLSVNLDNTISLSGSVTAGTGLIATSGGLTVTAGGITSHGITTINTSAVDYATSIGNETGSSQLQLQAGSSGIPITTNNGNITIDTKGGTTFLNTFSSTASDTYVGTEVGASTLHLSCGPSGDINIQTGGSGNISIGNSSSTNTVDVNAGLSGYIHIGTDAPTPIVLGENTGGSFLSLNVPAGNLSIPAFTNAGVLVTDGTGVIYDASGLTTSYVLTANGTGVKPSFQPIPSSSITLNGDTGSITGSTFTLAGGTNINTAASGSSVAFNLDNTINLSGSVTAGTGLIATTGGLTVTAGGITSHGITTINTTAVDYATSIGNETGSSQLQLQAGSSGIPITTNNGNITIDTKGGTTYLNTFSATASNTYLGGQTGSSTVNLSCGTSGGSINILSGGTGAIVMGNSTTTNTIDMEAGHTGYINIGVGNGTPITLGANTTTSSVTIATGPGYFKISAFTNSGALVTDGTGVIYDANASTSGYVLTSNGSGVAPSFQVAGGGSLFTWNDQTTSTVTLAVSNGYVMDAGSSLITATLPVTAAFGTVISIQGSGSGLWTIAQNAGQTIHFGAINTTTGSSGSLSSSNQYDCVDLLCISANTDWAVRGPVGNLSYV